MNRTPKNPWVSALVILVPIYLLAAYLGWLALKPRPSIFAEHYQEQVAQNAPQTPPAGP